MARIKSIRFDSVGKNEGCLCDRCGQYIKNIYTVTFQDGIAMNYGIDCFSKLTKTGNLTKQGNKNLKKAIERLTYWQGELSKWENGEYTDENRLEWQIDQKDCYSAWYGEPFEKYRKWMIAEFIPVRIDEAQKDIDRFSKINFDRDSRD